MMEFEWDEAKSAANIAKHGISFQTASRIFEGPIVTQTDDRHEYGEVREYSLGQIEGILIVAVIHTDRNGKCRIVSARRANRSERAQYEEAIR